MKKGRNALTAVILCALLTFLSVITCMAEDPSISEKENNNTWDTANSIIPGVPVTGSLDSLEDVDCYRFAVCPRGGGSIRMGDTAIPRRLRCRESCVLRIGGREYRGFVLAYRDR